MWFDAYFFVKVKIIEQHNDVVSFAWYDENGDYCIYQAWQKEMKPFS